MVGDRVIRDHPRKSVREPDLACGREGFRSIERRCRQFDAIGRIVVLVSDLAAATRTELANDMLRRTIRSELTTQKRELPVKDDEPRN